MRGIGFVTRLTLGGIAFQISVKTREQTVSRLVVHIQWIRLSSELEAYPLYMHSPTHSVGLLQSELISGGERGCYT